MKSIIASFILLSVVLYATHGSASPYVEAACRVVAEDGRETQTQVGGFLVAEDPVKNQFKIFLETGQVVTLDAEKCKWYYSGVVLQAGDN